MIRPDDFSYAMENTRVLIAPSSAIETFGTTSFRFRVVTEPMDEAGSSRLRTGMIHCPHNIDHLRQGQRRQNAVVGG